MSPETSYDLREVLERVHADLLAGRFPERRPEEVEIHAPSSRQTHGPVTIDPSAEEILRELLGMPAGDGHPRSR